MLESKLSSSSYFFRVCGATNIIVDIRQSRQHKSRHIPTERFLQQPRSYQEKPHIYQNWMFDWGQHKTSPASADDLGRRGSPPSKFALVGYLKHSLYGLFSSHRNGFETLRTYCTSVHGCISSLCRSSCAPASPNLSKAEQIGQMFSSHSDSSSSILQYLPASTYYHHYQDHHSFCQLVGPLVRQVWRARTARHPYCVYCIRPLGDTDHSPRAVE